MKGDDVKGKRDGKKGFLASFLTLTSLYLVQVGPNWVLLGGGTCE